MLSLSDEILQSGIFRRRRGRNLGRNRDYGIESRSKMGRRKEMGVMMEHSDVDHPSLEQDWRKALRTSLLRHRIP